MSSVKFEFLTHLEFFFQDSSYVYFVIAYCPGGDLFIQLCIHKKFHESVARFYIAQIILALEYLHSLDLVHRDIKPENILVNYDGYIKLTDFGLCTKITKRNYTFCGTAEYIAPEMLHGKGYGKSVDWWATGVLLFELVFGYTPFERKNKRKMFKLIGSGKFYIPKQELTLDLEELLRGLLRLDISRRLGCLKKGPKDIKNHKFFHNVHWRDLYRKRIKPPFKPLLKSTSDSSYFKTTIPEETEMLSAVNEFGDYFNILD